MIRKTVIGILVIASAMAGSWLWMGCQAPDGGQRVHPTAAPVVDEDAIVLEQTINGPNEKGECYKAVWDAQLNWYVHKRVDCPSSQSIRRRGPHTGARGGIFDNGGNKPVVQDSTK